MGKEVLNNKFNDIDQKILEKLKDIEKLSINLVCTIFCDMVDVDKIVYENGHINTSKLSLQEKEIIDQLLDAVATDEAQDNKDEGFKLRCLILNNSELLKARSTQNGDVVLLNMSATREGVTENIKIKLNVDKMTTIASCESIRAEDLGSNIKTQYIIPLNGANYNVNSDTSLRCLTRTSVDLMEIFEKTMKEEDACDKNYFVNCIEIMNYAEIATKHLDKPLTCSFEDTILYDSKLVFVFTHCEERNRCVRFTKRDNPDTIVPLSLLSNEDVANLRCLTHAIALNRSGEIKFFDTLDGKDEEIIEFINEYCTKKSDGYLYKLYKSNEEGEKYDKFKEISLTVRGDLVFVAYKYSDDNIYNISLGSMCLTENLTNDDRTVLKIVYDILKVHERLS